MLTYSDILDVLVHDTEIDNNYTKDNLTVEEVFEVDNWNLDYFIKWDDEVVDYKELSLTEQMQKDLNKFFEYCKQYEKIINNNKDIDYDEKIEILQKMDIEQKHWIKFILKAKK